MDRGEDRRLALFEAREEVVQPLRVPDDALALTWPIRSQVHKAVSAGTEDTFERFIAPFAGQDLAENARAVLFQCLRHSPQDLNLAALDVDLDQSDRSHPLFL